MRVAIVEDETDIARLYKAILASEGHEAWMVDQHRLGDIRDADCVLFDLMMPDVDGEAVMEWLLVNKPDIRRVVATAAYDVPHKIRANADAIVPKPFSPDVLIQAVTGGPR